MCFDCDPSSPTCPKPQNECQVAGCSLMIQCHVAYVPNGTQCNSGGGKICVDGACGECTKDEDCNPNITYCDKTGGPFDGTCRDCVPASGAEPARGCLDGGVCDALTDTCHAECAPIASPSSQCTASMLGKACIDGFFCGCTGANQAVDCAGLPGRPACVTSGFNVSTCRECNTNADCTITHAARTCGGAATNSDTNTYNTCGCTVANQAVDCAGIVGKPNCDPVTHTCQP